MNKQDYLNLLRYNLRSLPEVVVNDIVFDYEEHFRIGVENGKTEEQISEELGSPSVIAKEFVDSTSSKRKTSNFSDIKGSMRFEEGVEDKNIDWLKWIGIIALAIILAPVIVSLIVGLFSLIVGVFLAIGGVAIALIGSAIAMIGHIFFPGNLALPGLGIMRIFYSLNIITKISFVVFCFSLGIVVVWAAISFLKWAIETIKDLIVSAKWKMERRHEK